jgi:hypothetical protein
LQLFANQPARRAEAFLLLPARLLLLAARRTAAAFSFTLTNPKKQRLLVEFTKLILFY